MLRDLRSRATAELLDLFIRQGWKGNFVEIELRHGPWYTLSQNRTREESLVRGIRERGGPRAVG